MRRVFEAYAAGFRFVSIVRTLVLTRAALFRFAWQPVENLFL
jgi:hypothetical protein